MMIVRTKQVVSIEMDNVDFDLLLHTLEEASKVRSKLYPLMNQRAAQLRDSLTEGRMLLVPGPGGGDSDASHD